MAPPRGEVLQGTLDLIVLKTLEALGPLHGYGIAQRIQQVSEDLLRLNQGTLYPALLRLEQRGWIGEQPQSQVLHSDADGPKTIARRDRKLGADDGADGALTGRRGRSVR